MTSPLHSSLRHRSQSHISFLPDDHPFPSHAHSQSDALSPFRGGHFVVHEQIRKEFDDDGGSVLAVLQATPHQQLVHLLPQLQLPSPLGLFFTLVIPHPSARKAPKITDGLWSTLFSSHLVPDPSSSSHANPSYGGLPIAATLELKVDQVLARWWNGWLREGGDGFGVRMDLGVSARMGETERKRVESLDSVKITEQVDDRKVAKKTPKDSASIEAISQPAASAPRPSLSQQSLKVQICGSATTLRPSPSKEIPDPVLAPLDTSESQIALPAAREIPTPLEIFNLFPSPKSIPESPYDNGYTSSVPYSPTLSPPAPEALASQPFLQELEILLKGVQREKSGLSVEVEGEGDVPWAGLGSAEWSETTSWGPPDTPSPIPSRPVTPPPMLASAGLITAPKAGEGSSYAQHPKHHPKGHGHHPSWTFLPRGPVEAQPWEHNWPYYRSQDVPEPEGLTQFPRGGHGQVDEQVGDVVEEEQQAVEQVYSHPAPVSPQMSTFAKQQASPSPQAPVSQEFMVEWPHTAGSEFGSEKSPFSDRNAAVSTGKEEESNGIEGFDIITLFQQPSVQGKPEDISFAMAPRLFTRETTPPRPFTREEYTPDTPTSPFDSDTSGEDDEYESAAPGGALMDMMAPLSRVSAPVQPVMHARAPSLGTLLDVIDEAEDSSVESPLVTRDHVLPEMRDIRTTEENVLSQEEDKETHEGTVVSSSEMETWETRVVGEAELHTLTGREMPRVVENRETEMVRREVELDRRDPESSTTTSEEQSPPPPPYELMLDPPRRAMMGPFPQITSRPTSHLSSPNLINQISPSVSATHPSSSVGSLPDPHVRPDQHRPEGRPMSRGITGLDPRQSMRPTPPSFHADSSDSEEERRVEAWEQDESPQSRRSIFRPRFGRSQSHFDVSTFSTPVHAPRSSSISDLSSANIYRSSTVGQSQGARDSTFSLASVASASSKAPARPLKRLSKSVSGFSKAQSVEADGALNGLRQATMSLRDLSMYVEGKGYPYLEIYHPPRARFVSVPVYSAVYPHLVIYAPAKSTSVRKQMDIQLVDYSYPAIVLYPAAGDKTKLVLKPVSVRLVDYQYPAIVLYPAVYSSEVVKGAQVTLVEFSYPNIVLYPAACSVTVIRDKVGPTRSVPVELVEYTYPDMVLYPAISTVKPIPSPIIAAPETAAPASKSLRLESGSSTYPDLVIYPAVAPLMTREMETVHRGSTAPVKLVDYTYPHVVVYPVIAAGKGVKAPTRSTYQIMLVDYTYPNIVLYPAAATRATVAEEEVPNAQVELVACTHPDLVIYPAVSGRRSVEVTRPGSAVKVELVEYLYPDIVLYPGIPHTQSQARPAPVTVALASGTTTPSDNGYTSSAPYSPDTCFAQPSYEALSTQPFLMELHSLLEGVAEGKARGSKVEVGGDMPWKDLGSAQWSEATSWGPPDTPSDYEYPVATFAPESDEVAKPVDALRSVEVLLRPFAYPDLVIYPIAIQVKLVQYQYPDVVLYPIMVGHASKASKDKDTYQPPDIVEDDKAQPEAKYLSVADGLLEGAMKEYDAVRSSLSTIDTEMTSSNHHRSGSSFSSVQSASTQTIETPASALSPSSSTRSRSQSLFHSRAPSVSSLPPAKPPPKGPLPALPVTSTLKGDLPRFGHSRSSSSVSSTTEPTALETSSPGVLSPQSTGTRTPTRARSSTLVSERMEVLMDQTQKSPPLPPSAVNVRGIRSSTYGTMSPPNTSSTDSTPTKTEKKPGQSPVGKLSNAMFRNWQ
ncbi:hypothetical protein IAR50_003592 [Cryptococcus sp. DSM 104548]